MSRLFALLLALFALACGTPPAVAAEPGGSILVIMDVSGSMDRKDASGTVLIDGARAAVSDLLAELPADAPVGLRFYGSVYAGDDKAQGCRDTTLAVPIGPVSTTATAIQAAIDKAKPTGWTPIGGALKAAADDFPPEGKRSIILVSDGEDTCGSPAPCVVAKTLAGQGIDVKVDTVGLFLENNRAARQQLECVAKTTGGTFYDVDDADALGAQLGTAGGRAVQSFQADGSKVAGGPADTQATAIKVDTSYVDDVGAEESRWYSFRVPAGMVPQVELTEDGSTDYGCCTFLRVFDPEHKQGGSDNDYNTSGTAKSYRVTGKGSDSDGTHYVEVSNDNEQVKGQIAYQFRVTLTRDPSASPSPPSSNSNASPSDQQTTPAAESNDGLLWTIIGVLSVIVVALAGGMAVLFKRQSQRAPGQN